MGRKSTREDKNIWQRSREAAGMTRAEAAEAMGFVSESRIEKYESGRSPVQPEEVLAMSKAYRMPALCNQYCAHECPIGKEMVPEVRAGSLSQIVLETLAKDGVPTRAEITDAALSERSSCVMLNKGKYIVMAIRMLDKIVRRMEKFRTKSENVLPKLDGAEKLMLSHRKYDI